MEIIVEGPPIPAMRPRIKPGKMYDLQYKAKENFGWKVKSKMKPYFIPTRNAVILELEFHMPIPESLSRKKKEGIKGTMHIKRPDISNLIKFVEDALNGILWQDDSVIAKIKAKKIYSDTPKTVMNINFL